MIVIRHSAWQGKVGSTKAKKPRVFAISSLLCEQLHAIVNPDNPEAFIFATKKGTPWNGNDLVKDHLKPLLKQLRIKQDVAEIGAHAFRHGNLSIMDRENVPTKVRQERAGHFDFERLTLSVYTHSASQDHRDAAEKMGKKFAPILHVNERSEREEGSALVTLTPSIQ